MADHAHSKEVRSYNMSRIRSKNTKPEEIVRKFLFSKGFRYRKNDKRYSGCPDIVLPKHKTMILLMVASGTATRDARILLFPNPTKTTGYRSLKKIANEMRKTILLSEKLDGT